MKYIVIDDCGTDVFTEEYETKEEAIKAAELAFVRLTVNDLKKRSGFFVLESVNPDPEVENHMDGTVVKNFLEV